MAGLYAAGEAACVSINGANRLGSNSLTECLVFGAHTGLDAAEFALEHADSAPSNPLSEMALKEEKRIFDGILKKEMGKERVSVLRKELQRSMESYVGIFRHEEELERGCKKVNSLRERFKEAFVEDKEAVFNTELTAALELDFMLDVAETIAHSALKRNESRGSHARLDYPKRDDKSFLNHSLAYFARERSRIEYLPATITRWQPAARVY
jgi:succinate dehydrogenase/fumarate reductase flavoprotein subunit